MKPSNTIFILLFFTCLFISARAQILSGDFQKKWNVSLSGGSNLLPPASHKNNFGGQVMGAYNLKWQSHSPGTAILYGQICAGVSYYENNTDSSLFKYALLQPGVGHIVARLYIADTINSDFSLFAFGQAGFNSHLRRAHEMNDGLLFFEMFDIGWGIGARINRLGTISAFYQYNYASVLTDRGYEYYSGVFGATGFYRSLGVQAKFNLCHPQKKFQVNPYLRWQTFYKIFNQSKFLQLGIELSF